MQEELDLFKNVDVRKTQMSHLIERFRKERENDEVFSGTRSRSRLAASGPLTGQQDFVGRNCAKGQRERGLRLGPHDQEKKKGESEAQKPASGAKAPQSQKITQSTRGTRRALAMVGRFPRRVPRGYARKAKNRQLTSQVCVFQRFTQSTWDSPHTITGVSPVQCRRKTHRTRDTGSSSSPKRPSRLGRVLVNVGYREQWRGS
jgi:hypothetical protein